MESELIKKANMIAERGMAMGNGHDTDCPITDLATALTVIVADSLETNDSDDEIDTTDLYDFIESRID